MMRICMVRCSVIWNTKNCRNNYKGRSNIRTKMICSPGSYIQGNGEMRRLATYYKKLGKKSAYIIVDAFIYKNY